MTVLCGTVWDRDSLAVSGDGVMWDSVGRLIGCVRWRCYVGQCGIDSLGVLGDGVVTGNVGQRLIGCFG